ncbi:hypothetical protein OGZ51_06845 [Lactococcus lactis]|uniref:Uncharacterized protein n=1 Tax=Lactococcus lactis TaxID=1358 RepID=A0A9X4S4M9_9LACT|nr:hypothetical protein [Lactococcus lactis]MDG4983858.1 hypothetical protein [Lactococcus lactis]
MKKHKMWISVGLAIVVLMISFGIKKHKEESKIVVLEKKAAIEVKENSREIKEIKITEFNESPAGVKNINYAVIETSGRIVKGNCIKMGNFGFESKNGLIGGKTEAGVNVTYTNGKKR